VARASITAAALPLRFCLSRDAFVVCGDGIEPEGSSCEGLAMRGAGFDGRSRVSASL
jgi:hypothetical protein